MIKTKNNFFSTCFYSQFSIKLKLETLLKMRRQEINTRQTVYTEKKIFLPTYLTQSILLSFPSKNLHQNGNVGLNLLTNKDIDNYNY